VAYSRRLFLGTALTGAAVAVARPLVLRPEFSGGAVPAPLLRRALDALEQHRAAIPYRDVIGIADFSQHSRTPRFHIVDVTSGRASTHLVAHGRGSDPARTGWLERFSNEPRSNATSSGAYRTESVYVGGHGRSLRLQGLDGTNSNAEARAIVVHGAWYVSVDMIGRCGMLGRSEGCFAVANSSLEEVLTRLAPGRLLYADRA
jgi:L,D-transpeptidase catalytic domain